MSDRRTDSSELGIKHACCVTVIYSLSLLASLPHVFSLRRQIGDYELRGLSCGRDSSSESIRSDQRAYGKLEGFARVGDGCFVDPNAKKGLPGLITRAFPGNFLSQVNRV